MKDKHCDVLIIGGGLGGVAAALAALKLGKRVILTEETDWVGGQLTSQAVPPDENPWIESIGCTASYRRLRNGIRDYYRQWYPMKPEWRERDLINPGEGRVSKLCHEPRVALAVLEAMFAPYRASAQVEVLLRTIPVSVEMDGDTVRAVTVQDLESGNSTVLSAPFVLDATELGDLLEMGGIEYVVGAESQAETGEPHAVTGDAEPMNQQAISWCFAMDYRAGEDHTIEKPPEYEFYRTLQLDGWPGPQLGWYDVYPHTLAPRYKALFETSTAGDGRDDFTFWNFRQIFAADHYIDGRYPSDITIVNWPAIDYWCGPLVGVSEEVKQKHLHGAMQLSRSMLYWMQTEAPRHDGGMGYPELRLRGDITGTGQGLAKSVYVREARRIRAETIVLEQHVSAEVRQGAGAVLFHDSVGIGSYRIDLHPSTTGRNYVDISSYPFQIPLGSLVPIRVENLLPACKNLGVTHITNGCYRLHPVEWNIGEAAGALASFCLEHGYSPRQVRNTPKILRDFQSVLADPLGFELSWPDYARLSAR
jgi:hypothetical protein